MHKYTQTKHQKPNNNNEHTVSQQTSELPTTNTTTTINKTNHSPNPTDYDTETQYEENDNSTVVSQNLNSHTQVTEQKNEKEIKSKSMNTFHSIRKYTMSPQSKKINKTFKILAVICIFMWWTRTVTAACSLMIWHYDYLIAVKISFPWDTFRGQLYHTSKLIMYLTYITRIHFAFNKSAYGYSQWFIIMMYVLICTDY
eukprot:512726_1